jgi:hypothetical protein
MFVFLYPNIVALYRQCKSDFTFIFSNYVRSAYIIIQRFDTEDVVHALTASSKALLINDT